MITIVLGTRPEIIKMSPVIRELRRQSVDYFVLHTGQHYSYNMDKVFFEQLQLPPPEFNINVGSGSHAEETGKMLIGIEGCLKEEAPGTVSSRATPTRSLRAPSPQPRCASGWATLRRASAAATCPCRRR